MHDAYRSDDGERSTSDERLAPSALEDTSMDMSTDRTDVRRSENTFRVTISRTRTNVVRSTDRVANQESRLASAGCVAPFEEVPFVVQNRPVYHVTKLSVMTQIYSSIMSFKIYCSAPCPRSRITR